MIDPAFYFSQHSLADFVACPRRFYLRHIAHQAWPLIESAPWGMDALTYREYLRKGALLHQWIERYWLGLESAESKVLSAEGRSPASTLGTTPSALSTQHLQPHAQDPELSVWWARFLAEDFSALPPQRLPELALVAPLGDARLYGRFDLLAFDDAPQSAGRGDVVIVDWKTLRGERAPSEAFLRRRVQTRVYLYVLATAGAPYNGGRALAPEQCVMRYWLANFPEQPWVEIRYSQAAYDADRAWLLDLAQDCARRAASANAEDAFEKTADERQCTYCTFRTLCRRSGLPEGAEVPDEEARLIDLSEAQELDY